MAKYILDFPEKKTLVRVSVSPMQIRELAGQYVDRQSLAFGTICLVRADNGTYAEDCEIIAVAVSGKVNKPEFFVKESPIDLMVLEEEK